MVKGIKTKKKDEVSADLDDEDEEQDDGQADSYQEGEDEEPAEPLSIKERKKILLEQLKEIETYEMQNTFVKDAPKQIAFLQKQFDGLFEYVKILGNKMIKLEEDFKLLVSNTK